MAEEDRGGRAYYLGEKRITPSQFRRLSRAKKIEVMVQWFQSNYEDPAHHTSYNSREGGYLWNNGGPYDADDEIQNEFSDLVDFETMQEAVGEVTSEGLYEWAPVRRDFDDDGDLFAIDEPFPDIAQFDDEVTGNEPYLLPDEEPTLPDAPVEAISVGDAWGRALSDIDFESGRDRESTRAAIDADFRRELLSRVDQLEAAIEEYKANLPPRNHNRPPELVEPDPISPEDVKTVLQAARELRSQAAKDQPDGSRLSSLATQLKAVAVSIVKWMGRKADLAVDTVIKAALPAAGALWVFKHPEKAYAAILAVSDTASAWAQHLASNI